MHPDSTAPEVPEADQDDLSTVDRSHVADAPEDDDPQASAGEFCADAHATDDGPDPDDRDGADSAEGEPYGAGGF